jgi:DNA polymerase alpha subunit A
VVDDGVGGYNDHGQEDWDREESHREHEHDAHRKRQKASGMWSQRIYKYASKSGLIAKSKTSKKAEKPMPKAPPPVPSANAYRPAISAAKEQDLLDSIMHSLDDATEVLPPSPRLPRKRKSSPLMSSSPAHHPYHDSSSNHDLSSDGAEMLFEEPAVNGRPKRQRTASDGVAPDLEFSKLEVKAEEDYDSYFSEIGNDAFMEPVEVHTPPKAVPKKFEYKTDDPEPKALKLPDTQPAWLALHSALKTADEETIGVPLRQNFSAITPESVLEANGNFHFYWLDYLELDGKIYLTGKTRDKQQGVWVSCCVIVENIERNLFVFPKSKIDKIVERQTAKRICPQKTTRTVLSIWTK